MQPEKKLVVITGASAGIGTAIAQEFASKGYPLLLLARRLEKMEALKLPNTLCLKCDVTNYAELENCIKEGEKKFGPVDLLVNNAGVMYLHADSSAQSIDEWNQMIDLNIKGLLNGIKIVLPGMKERKCGTIIDISSVCGKKTMAGFAVYCGTKFFVHAVTENMREEMASFNVRFVTIAPGAVESEIVQHTTDQTMKQGLQQVLSTVYLPLPAKRIAESVFFAYNMPQDCCIREICVAPTKSAV